MKQPFEQVVAAHGATVMRVCRTVLVSAADAEDAWSETFLAALRAWPELPADANVEAWLVRVAQRKAIDIVRRQGRQAVPTDRVADRPATDGIPGEHEGLWEAVGRLPERQRLAVAYHYLGGLPHAETAERIGGTPVAVRRSCADGIKKLRSLYDTHDHTHGHARDPEGAGR